MKSKDKEFNRLYTVLNSYKDYQETYEDSIFKDQKEGIVFTFQKKDIGIFVKFFGDILTYVKSFNTILKISYLYYIKRCTIFNKDGGYITFDVIFLDDFEDSK